LTSDVWAYSTESYDAVILLALAALAAGSTDSARHGCQDAGGLRLLRWRQKCGSFAECAEIINGGGVADYDGLSGGIALGDNGDPTEAAIGIYEYDADNRPQTYKG